MTLGWKVGLALAGVAYLSVPIVKRLGSGCPALAGSSQMVRIVGAPDRLVQVCEPASIVNVLLWPVGLFFAGK